MKTFHGLFASFLESTASRSVDRRAAAKRSLACETLEGRRLMSADMPGWATWGTPGTPPTGAPPADVHAFNASGHDFKSGAAHPGGKGGPKFTLSTQAKADMTALKNDMKTLQSEVPASLTATLKADQAVIAKAFAANAPTTHQVPPKLGKPGDHSFPPGSDPSANLVSMLEKAGVSATDATRISTDFQTYQTDLKTLDPTLQTKITADQATLQKDGAPAPLHGPHGNMPIGMPMTPPSGIPSSPSSTSTT